MMPTRCSLIPGRPSPRKAMRIVGIAVIVFAFLVVLLSVVLRTMRSKSHRYRVERAGLAIAAHFNSDASVALRNPVLLAQETGTAKRSMRPWLIDCQGDQLNLDLQYDSDNHTWINFIGRVNPAAQRDTCRICTANDAVQLSLAAVKVLDLMPEGSKVRVKYCKHLSTPHLWSVAWEVQTRDQSVYSVFTQMDEMTGLPQIIHNGQY